MPATKSLLFDCVCESAELRPDAVSDEPFLSARLSIPHARELRDRLDQLAQSDGREWYFLVWSSPDIRRLRLVHMESADRTPAFERKAWRVYLRNELFRVTGRDQSCNINFSGATGAASLRNCLDRVLPDAVDFIEISVRVISRKKKSYLLEFFADTTMPCDLSEAERIGAAGEGLAQENWGCEDFSDWETERD